MSKAHRGGAAGLAVALGLATGTGHALNAPPSFGTEQRNAGIRAEISQDLPPGRLQATVFCLDGYRFAVAAILGHGTAAAPSVGMVQVYENRGGQVVPATCSNP